MNMVGQWTVRMWMVMLIATLLVGCQSKSADTEASKTTKEDPKGANQEGAAKKGETPPETPADDAQAKGDKKVTGGADSKTSPVVTPTPSAMDNPPPLPTDQAEALAGVPVMGVLELPSLQKLGAVVPLVSAFERGAGAMVGPGLSMGLRGATGGSWEGIAIDEAIRVFVVDPKTYPEPLVILVSVKDDKAMRAHLDKHDVEVRDGLALIGPKGSLAAVQDGIFKAYAGKAVPSGPRATVLVPTLVKTFATEIDGFKKQLPAMAAQGAPNMGGLVDAYVGLFEAFTSQITRVDIGVSSGQGMVGVHLTFTALPDTTMANFFAAQKPSAFATLEKLPNMQPAAMIAAADAQLTDELRTAFGLFVVKMMNSFYSGDDDLISGGMKELMALSTGHLSMVMSDLTPTPRMTQYFGVSDTAKAVASYNTYAKAIADKSSESGGLDIMGIKQTMGFTPNKGLVHKAGKE